jgi:hypothetical protein
MHPFLAADYQMARHADLLREAAAYRAAAAHRPRGTRRGLLRRRRTA